MKINYLKMEFDEAMILLVIIFLVGIVIAQPGIPHQFYGKVVCQNNNIVPDNIAVTIKSQNNLIKSTSVFNSTYGYNPLFLIWDIDKEITTLDFYVNNQFVVSSQFIEGGVTNLDLIVNSSLCDISNIGPQNPSSSGGSGGNGPTSALTYIGNSPETPDKSKNNNSNKIENKNLSDLKLNESDVNSLSLFPQKMDKTVALNISIFTLILMALVAFYSIRSLKKKAALLKS